MTQFANLQFLIFLAGIVHPTYNAGCFVMYMLLQFCKILRQQQSYTVHAVSSDFLKSTLGCLNIWDIDNTVVVNGVVPRETVELAVISANAIRRRIFLVTKAMRSKSEAVLSHNLSFNMKDAVRCVFMKCKQAVNYADEVELALISSPNEWNQHVVDTCVKNYFRTPKLLYTDDVIEVKLKYYGRDLFFTTNKITNFNCSLYFKCHKIVCKGLNARGSCFCARDRSTVRQVANLQSFIPKNLNATTESDCLDGVLEELKQAVLPFIAKRPQDFRPTFLLEGRKGSGKSLLVQSIASYFGMHLYTISSSDVSANVYAQNESKLRNAFFNAKMAAPAILEIINFENFGKNNEGQYDDRLINNFSEELKHLFQNEEFPLILFCSSNEKTIPTQLRRTFLKTFECKAPSEQEKEKLLRLILKTSNMDTNINLKNVAIKTHGFLLEDLRALVHYAITDFRKDNADSTNFERLEEYFLRALDFMQSNFNESLGAPKIPNVKWSDVGGLTDVKEEITRTIKLAFKQPQLLEKTGLKRSGLLLYGPPGTGKTLIAKAVATECGLCFLSVKGPELLNKYVGQSEQNVRDVFERAREASPCIIFFDELDSLAPNRGMSGDSGGVMDRIVSQLLAEMDGLTRTTAIFIIAATNRPDLIDPALLRPGRFDKLLYVGPCTDRESKAAVLKALTRKFKFAENTTIEQIIDLCPENFSGADLYGVCSNAWLCAVRRLLCIENGNKHIDDCSSADICITLDDFQSAIKNVKPSIKQEDLEYFHKLKLGFK